MGRVDFELSRGLQVGGSSSTGNSGHDDPERPELARVAAPQVELEEGRRGEKDGGAVLVDEFADRGGIERIGMKDDAESQVRRAPE